VGWVGGGERSEKLIHQDYSECINSLDTVLMYTLLQNLLLFHNVNEHVSILIIHPSKVPPAVCLCLCLDTTGSILFQSQIFLTVHTLSLVFLRLFRFCLTPVMFDISDSF